MIRWLVLLLILGSTSFGAESVHLKAQVDFPFRAFLMDMPAGRYEVSMESSGGLMRLYVRNGAERKQVVLTAQASNSDAARPSLTFSCIERSCGLTGISMGEGQWFKTTKPRFTSAETERIVTVYLERLAGD